MTSTVTHERQERILSAVRKGQEITLGVIKTTVHAASRVTSKIPEVKLPREVKLPFEGKLPKLGGKLREFEGKLPKPESLVSGTYDFAEKLLAEQRKFAVEVLKTTAALRPAARETTGEVTGQAAGEAAKGGATANGAAGEDAAGE